MSGVGSNINWGYRNIFFLVSVVFIIWMLFFDTNSWLIHRVLNKEIEVLELKKEFYNSEIKSDQEQLKALETSEGLEAFARENYNMKRKNEDIYIIASDTVNQAKWYLISLNISTPKLLIKYILMQKTLVYLTSITRTANSVIDVLIISINWVYLHLLTYY